jgi:hypothetical protein
VISQKIKNGDIAVIIWQDRKGIYLPPEDITILHLPQGEGDLIQIQYHNGLAQAFSPSRIDYVLEKR